jgi:RNA polymerase sigma-70 factor (ECF subfamily)
VSTSVEISTTIGGSRFGAASGDLALGLRLVIVPAGERRGAPPVEAPASAEIDARRAAALAPMAFDEFYRVEYPRVVAVAQSLTGSRQLAEELAQEGFIAAHSRWNKIGAYDRPGDWVRRVVTNRAISVFRRKNAEKRALARVGPDATVTPPVPDEDAWLWQQVRELPPRQAQAIALVYVEDLPLERVAVILGCAETTVKTHLARGRQALARAIERRNASALADDARLAAPSDPLDESEVAS